MNYWIFVANFWKLSTGEWIDSREIIRTRANDRFWGLGENTPNRKWLERGDKIVWYASGGDVQAFIGTATLASASYRLDAQRLKEISHGLEDYESPYGVDLEGVELWSIPKPVRDLVPSLSFIENKDYWGAYLQGGIRAITPDDFLLITEGVARDVLEQAARQTDLASASEFALEHILKSSSTQTGRASTLADGCSSTKMLRDRTAGSFRRDPPVRTGALISLLRIKTQVT